MLLRSTRTRRRVAAYSLVLCLLCAMTLSARHSGGILPLTARAQTQENSSRGKLDLAHAALTSAQEAERAAGTKQAALDTQSALDAFNRALADHRQALQRRMVKLESRLKGGDGKTLCACLATNVKS